jgi:hypothetical protein
LPRRQRRRGRNKTEICSGGAGRKRGVGKMNSRPALAAARKIFEIYLLIFYLTITISIYFFTTIDFKICFLYNDIVVIWHF